MNIGSETLVGAAWLVAHHAIQPVAPLATLSRIGGRRASRLVGDVATETYVEAMRPGPDLRGHLTFHLKHEVPHLELLARVFQVCDPAELTAWVEREPTGQYARRAGFLYEWLTGRDLSVAAEIGGAYVNAIDPDRMVAASAGLAPPNRRWRVRDNLPGTPAFCPTVRKTMDAERAMALDVPALIQDLTEEFGEDVLVRSAVWMTLRESRSSFAIEGEADQADRIQRFADVLGRRTGEGPWPLDDETLAELQAEILGGSTTVQRFGIRQSPVFVGETVRFREVVHYVAPPPGDLVPMLQGLKTFLERTQGQSCVMRSAVAAFGFVYLHPMADGNGRVHRLLVNDVLRRDGVMPPPLILPVSALIDGDRAERRAYDRILDEVSAPLMRSLAGQYEFAPTPTRYPDGITANLVFRGDDLARPAWRMPDLTKHVSYLSDVIERTIRDDMREEARLLRSHARARVAIKDIIEMPDHQLDRVIRSVEANRGTLSNLLAAELPALATSGVWEAILGAIEAAFEDGPRGDSTHRYRPRRR